MSRRARELAEQGSAFVTATVVRAQRPTSVEAGDAALVLGDGTIEGFVGGECAEHSVRAHALKAIESGEAVLLRILPFDSDDEGDPVEEDRRSGARPRSDRAALLPLASEPGAVTVQNPCLSGGAIEVFLEPILRAPRVLVEGDTPIARALHRLGPELGLDVVGVGGEQFELRPDDLAVVAVGHGHEELGALRRGLEADLPYVGLVASKKRGQGVIGELRGDGVPDLLLERIDTPAGLDIGARTPGEIALSILARIVAVRRAGPASATTAVDPICGMTVGAVESTLSIAHDGETVYFCGEGCKSAFEKQHGHALAD